MKRTSVKRVSIILVLALLLSVLPMSAFAAGHVHNFTMTPTVSYEQSSAKAHIRVQVDKYTCSCGYAYNVTNRNSEGHSFSAPKYLNSYIGDDGRTYAVYRITCWLCQYSYTISSPVSNPTIVVEETD